MRYDLVLRYQLKDPIESLGGAPRTRCRLFHHGHHVCVEVGVRKISERTECPDTTGLVIVCLVIEGIGFHNSKKGPHWKISKTSGGRYGQVQFYVITEQEMNH